MLPGCTKPYDFPHDPALPGSRLLQGTSELVRALSSLLADGFFADARLVDTRVGIRHHVPGKRCVAQVDLLIVRKGGSAETRRLTVRLYPDDKGAEVYETLRQLRSHGFAAGPFTVAEPLAYDPARHLVILDWARGESLRSLLLARADVSQALARAAQWLLKLHTCGVRRGRRYDFGRHLHTLSVQGRHLTEAFPKAGRLYSDILSSVGKRGSSISGWTPAPTHRDFTPEHLLFDGDQLTALDFDEFCHYDPLFDVGHFLAHLRLIALSSTGTSNDSFQWAESFEASYKAGIQDHSEARIRFYQAVAYLKLAYVIGVAERPPNRVQMVSALLNEAQHVFKEN